MASIEQSIDVDVPVRTAYDQWTQFEEFPAFMEGVKEVRQLDDKHLHWRAEVLGKDVEWTADIVQQIPDERITWRSTSGAKNGGTITFVPQGAAKTKLQLRIEYEPEGAAESTASAIGLVSQRVAGDLARFKDFIEKRGRATGEWRGEIHGQDVTRRASKLSGM
jgi:uncharacterized membrane protein